MSIYKVLDGTRGKRYLKNGRLFSVNKIPIDILEKLGHEPVVDDTPVSARTCVFCGMEGCKLSRSVNGNVVDLCADDYYSKNLGQVAQKVRELQTAPA